MSFEIERNEKIASFYGSLNDEFISEFQSRFNVDTIEVENRSHVFNWLDARINEPDHKASCLKIGRMLREKGWKEAEKWLAKNGFSIVGQPN